MTDEAAQLAAVVTALGGAAANAYAVGYVPGTKPQSYNEVFVHRRFGGNKRTSDPVPETIPYRALIRSIGKSHNNALEMRRLAGLLEGTTLTVGGEESTPLEFETSEPVGLDDGWFSGTLQLTYSI